MKYTVKNIYGIQGESKHRKLVSAILAMSRREGAGWIVVDENGEQVTV